MKIVEGSGGVDVIYWSWMENKQKHHRDVTSFTTVLFKWSFLQPWARTDSEPPTAGGRLGCDVQSTSCVLDESVHQCQWCECEQVSGWFPTFITEDSSPADLTLTRPVTVQAVITASCFTAAVCREEPDRRDDGSLHSCVLIIMVWICLGTQNTSHGSRFHSFTHSHIHSHADDRGCHARCQLLIRSNLGFSILLKDT